jgi:hypothetical protein
LNYQALIVEGDSQILIEGLKKILNGTHPERVSENWRLLFGFSEIATTVRGSSTIVPRHVRRKGNVVVDYLVNMVVLQTPRMNKWRWQEVGPGPFRDMITHLTNEDTLHMVEETTGEIEALGSREPDVPT